MSDKKEAPNNPNGEKEENWKLYSCLGYAAVMLIIGVPIWWQTTTVTRVELPYATIDGLTSLNTAIKVNFLLVSSDAQFNHILGPKIQSQLKDSTIYEFQLSSRALTQAEEGAVARSNTVEDLDSLLETLHSKVLPGTIVVFEVPSSSKIKLRKKIVLGKFRTLFFAQTFDKYEYDPLVRDLVLIAREKMLGERAVKNLASSIQAPNHELNTRWNLRRVISAPVFDLQFSLLVPEPEILKSSWDIERAIEEHLRPLFDDLQDVVQFNIKSQVLYLTGLSLTPRQQILDDGRVVYAVGEDSLGLAVNMESQLASHISSNPAINFLAYIPTREQSPLYIVDSDGKVTTTNAFLIPRWGGVVIHNIEEGKIDTDALMGIFLAQLRSLLGLIDGSDRSVEKSNFESLEILGSDTARLRTWEKEFLMRMFLVEGLYSSRVTLQSLSHLLSTISNIVIGEDIGREIHNAVDDFQDSVNHARTGQLQEAFAYSQSSRSAAEKAFFDNSLLALLYFPEDQKYAIYIPLFLPIAFSFFSSFVPLVQKVLAKFKGQRTTTPSPSS